MSSFTTPLCFETTDREVKGRSLVKVSKRFEYHVGHIGSGEVITISENFETDFASTPRLTWIVFPPFGRYAKAAVLHDWLYKTHLKSKKEADLIFLESMRVLKVPRWKRRIMYWSVRTFGRPGWKRDGREKERWLS